MPDSDRVAAFELHSQASGSHWVAWLTERGSARPLKSVIVVGRTRDEAEQRARSWAEEAARKGYV